VPIGALVESNRLIDPITEQKASPVGKATSRQALLEKNTASPGTKNTMPLTKRKIGDQGLFNLEEEGRWQASGS